MVVTLAVPHAASADAYFHTYRNALVHWTTPEVTVHVDPRVVDALGERLTDVVRAAADTWAVSADVPVFNVKEARTNSELSARDGLVWLTFGEPEQFVTEVALTIATTDANSGEVQRVQVLLNPGVKWGYLHREAEMLDRYDLQAVLTHEFGHVLGLDENEHGGPATMNPQFRRGQVHQRTLEPSDEQSVSELYHEFPPSAEDRSGCSVTPRAESGSERALSFVAMFGALTFASRRRLRGQAR
jgi:hypothetical protein